LGGSPDWVFSFAISGSLSGWTLSQPTGPNSPLELAFVPGAVPLVVNLLLSDPSSNQKSSLGSLTRTIRLDTSVPNLSLATASVSGTSLNLSWLDDNTGGLGVGARRIILERSDPSLTSGCSAWSQVGSSLLPGDGTTLSDPSLSPSSDTRVPGLLTNLPSIGHMTFSIGSILPFTNPNGNRVAPAGHRVSASIVGLTAACYRLRIQVYSVFGHSSETVTDGVRLGLVTYKNQVIPAFRGTFDVYKPGSFHSQINYTSCTAAVVQMMLGLIMGEKKAPNSSANQMTLLAYSQGRAGLSPALGGSGPDGMAATLSHYSGRSYEVAKVSTYAAALRLAATRIRLTGLPVGVIVWGGRHAWTITGFKSKTDPAVNPKAVITSVIVSGPLYPRTPQGGVYDPKPDTSLTAAVFSSRFTPSYGPSYVLVVPMLP